MRRTLVSALVLLAAPALAEGPVLDLPNFPDYVILGAGAGPRQIGADQMTGAVVPAGRISFGERYVSLEANYLSINLLGGERWRAGPAGILRFGRSGSRDDRIDRLPEVDMSIDLGGFLAFEVAGTDPRDRWRAGIGLLQDVSGVHDGYVLDFSARRWLPLGDYAALGVGIAASWASESYMDSYFSVDDAGAAASGLPRYSAGAGWRDLRVSAFFVQPVSPEWAVGAGMLYSYLLDEAGHSPTVQSRGQLFAGIGAARAF